MTSAPAPPAARRARLDECAEIAALAAALLPELWSPEQIAGEIAMPEGRVWVIRGAGRLAAFLVARRELDEFHILLLGVDPPLRRAGLGRRLLETALAHEAGIACATLEVRESNAGARAFYARLGFCEAGRRPRHYAGGEAAILMSMTPSPRG